MNVFLLIDKGLTIIAVAALVGVVAIIFKKWLRCHKDNRAIKGCWKEVVMKKAQKT